MTATLLGSDAKTSGSAGTVSTLPTALTFPAGVTSGDHAFLLAVDLNNSAINDITGWTGGAQEGINPAGARLFRKVCTGTESGTTVNFALTGTGSRLAGVLFVVHGGDAPTEAVLATNNAATVPIPTVKPTANNCLLVSVAALRFTTASPTATATGGFTEDKDSATTNASGGVVGVWLGHQTLGASSSGVASPSGNLTIPAGTGSGGVVWTFAFPASGSGGGNPPPAGWVEVRLFGKSA